MLHNSRLSKVTFLDVWYNQHISSCQLLLHLPQLCPVTLKKETVCSYETLEQTFTMQHENLKNNHHLDSYHENLELRATLQLRGCLKLKQNAPSQQTVC